MEPETSPIITRDLVPAEVTLPDSTLLSPARAVLTKERLYVWVDGPSGVTLAFEAPYDPIDTNLVSQPWVIATSDGPVHVNRGRGCGCGSPLKTFAPFTPMRSGT